MTTKVLFLEQFTAAYDENGWFVALKDVLNNLTAEQAVWKAENLDNSIWEVFRCRNQFRLQKPCGDFIVFVSFRRVSFCVIVTV